MMGVGWEIFQLRQRMINESIENFVVTDGTSSLLVQRSRTTLPATDFSFAARSQFIAEAERQARQEAEKAMRVRSR
jgi:hypothetical protein